MRVPAAVSAPGSGEHSARAPRHLELPERAFRVYREQMHVLTALVVLAVVAGFAVVYWRTSPRHRVAAVTRADHGERARRAREAARVPHRD